jgi:putative proteasome-type protease
VNNRDVDENLQEETAMTYCCGILVREGIVMLADTRTNAGVDNISTFRKLHRFVDPGKYVMLVASAGNLSATQSVMHLVSEGFENPETKALERLTDCRTMFEAAQFIGRAVRRIFELEGAAYEQSKVKFEVSFLFGGQIGEDAMRLFMIYAAGNFIECGKDAPYFQIGEYKYGKPVLDRAVNFDSDIYDGLKVALVSMDSTMRSNIGVGLPIDIAVSRRDSLELEVDERIDHTEPYFHDLRDRWSTALKQAHAGIPRPPYGKRKG